MPLAIAVLSGPRLYSSAMPSYSFLTSMPATAAFATCALAARHMLLADMSISSFYSSVCHNSLFTCLFYYILGFVHTGSLLFYSFLIVYAIDDPCRSGTLASCISSVTCMPLHPVLTDWSACIGKYLLYNISNTLVLTDWSACIAADHLLSLAALQHLKTP